MEFWERLKRVREILNLSQEALARELGVSFATVNRLESDKSFPSYATLNSFDNFCRINNISFEEDDNK